jgi:alkanesulfonate monooxygenase SsuD/methylene tetrahydromethanopterin reductase-like flavin-dependent oxidoreductase (luciferase family)
MQRVSLSLPIYNASMSKLQQMAKWAEDAQFETAWDYEFFRSPFMTLGAAALATERIKLGTGITVAFSRSPMVTANEAADVDELSQGRMVLGIGAGAGEFLQAWHNTDLVNAVPRLREYVEAMRVIWGSVGTGNPAAYTGSFYNLKLGGVRRPLVRERIPVYLAGVQPQMIQLAGEIADGLLGFFYSPKYLQEVVHPNLALGAQRGGRAVAGVDLCSFVICSVSKDRSEARRRARIQTGYYAVGSGAICRWHGLEKEYLAIRDALMTKGPQALESTDDKLVDAFSICGTPDECRRQLADYEELLPLPLLHTPYFDPLTVEETEDAYRGILETFGQ